MKPTVYTYITTGYDIPRSEGRVYNEKDLDNFKEPTRNARQVKILSHFYTDGEWSLWTDGTIQLLKRPEQILEKYGSKGDFITFHHRVRDCVYDEAKAVFWGKRESNQEVVDEQMALYRKEGYPEHNGLFETGVILRHHTPEIMRFNEFWWALNCRFSKRDQLSANYAAWKCGIKVGYFDGNLDNSDDFVIHGHQPNRIFL